LRQRQDAPDFAIILVSFVVLTVWRAPPLVSVAGSAMDGVAR
jgi:hypothetical protein